MKAYKFRRPGLDMTERLLEWIEDLPQKVIGPIVLFMVVLLLIREVFNG